MQNKPVNLLFRKDLKTEDFNDDTMGRALDRPFENDPTKIFMQITLRKEKQLRDPLMRWVFQIFEGIHLLVESGGGASDIVSILNIRDVRKVG